MHCHFFVRPQKDSVWPDTIDFIDHFVFNCILRFPGCLTTFLSGRHFQSQMLWWAIRNRAITPMAGDESEIGLVALRQKAAMTEAESFPAEVRGQNGKCCRNPFKIWASAFATRRKNSVGFAFLDKP
jgi:hypothetical protein